VTFSEEEEQFYSHRFENGHDLYDPKYVKWLSIHHPVAASIRNNEPIADLLIIPVVTPVHIDLQPSSYEHHHHNYPEFH